MVYVDRSIPQDGGAKSPVYIFQPDQASQFSPKVERAGRFFRENYHSADTGPDHSTARQNALARRDKPVALPATPEPERVGAKDLLSFLPKPPAGFQGGKIREIWRRLPGCPRGDERGAPHQTTAGNRGRSPFARHNGCRHPHRRKPERGIGIADTQKCKSGPQR